TDPTVIYGTKDYQGKILRSHLAADHPYNTYIHPGLPPTPIANPSLASLEAAAHPADTKYLYFVAKGEGKSYFSQTLREHNAAVQKYLRSKGK
ncbi:endolytic transglycosylase MltG, partial [Turicimonas muris]